MKKELFISTDVETNGPIPGINSMLSLASLAIDEDGNEISIFEINLKELEGATKNKETMEWWKTNKEAYDETRKNILDPEIAISKYYDWLAELKKDFNIVFVAYPVAFDFMWCFWYLMKFKGESPFGHNGIDIRSYAMAMFKKSYNRSGKNIYPEEWFDGLTLTHKAIDDARMQGHMFINMIKANKTHSFKE